MKDKQPTQEFLQDKILKLAQVNVVSCGSCGGVFFEDKTTENDTLLCPHCAIKIESCACPDLFYEGWDEGKSKPAKTVEILSVNELSDEAKEKAHQSWLENRDRYDWMDENIDTLEAFCKLFGIEAQRYKLGTYSNVGIDMDDIDDKVLALSGIRLSAYIHNNFGKKLKKGKYRSIKADGRHLNHPCIEKRTTTLRDGTVKLWNTWRSKVIFEDDYNCALTGYYMDNEILYHVYEQLSKFNDRTFEELLTDCIQQFEKAVNLDCEHQESMEYFLDEAEANEFEYTPNGKRY